MIPLLTLLLLAPVPTISQEANSTDEAPALFPEGYDDFQGLSERLQALAEAHPEAVHLRPMAQSVEGREVWLVRLGADPDEGDAPPTAALIVATLEADHLVGGSVALGLIERLAEPEDGPLKDFLDDRTLYIIPRLNPDGAERCFGSPRYSIVTNVAPDDPDRDGAVDEDGGDDLDGDALILRMRARDDDATLVPDADDPRILRPAKPDEGERAVYSEYIEGIDDDGDGAFNEDPIGGVNLNRNWPHGWSEFDDLAGYSPASAPEVRPLIQFCADHPELALIWTFAKLDTLRDEPKKPASTIDDKDLPLFVTLSKSYRDLLNPPKEGDDAKDVDEEEEESGDDAPNGIDGDQEPTPIEAGDEDPLDSLPDTVREQLMAAFEELPEDERDAAMEEYQNAPIAEKRRLLNEAMANLGIEPEDDQPESMPSKPVSKGPKEGSALGATTDGALSEWAYHQFGALAISSSLWPGPDLPEPVEGEDAPPEDLDARWLHWNDEVMDGRAFLPFHEVEHPTLGLVEVGGWLPGVRHNPPIGEVEAIVELQHRFLNDLAGRFAELRIVDARAESRGAGVFEVTARVENAGFLPTALARGVTTRQAPPVLVRPLLGDARLLAGPPLDRIDALEGSGGSEEYRWLILAPEGLESIEIEATCPRAGGAVESIELR